MRIFAAKAIQNNGIITAIAKSGVSADGTVTNFGQSGGGGGVLIAASAGLIGQSGNIDVSGGRGGDGTQTSASNKQGGGGGGGGGGLIRLLAPVVHVTGQNIIKAGANGMTGNATSIYGAYGGASAGNGGLSAERLGTDRISIAPYSAGDGLVLINRCNPSALLMN